MKLLHYFLVVLLLLLQYRLFVADGNLMQLQRLSREIETERSRIEEIERNNRTLLATIESLRNGTGALEERARYQLGLIKEGEVFYQVGP